MKTLRSGDAKKIEVRANNAARLFYYENFKSELDKDLDTFLNPRAGAVTRLLKVLSDVNLTELMEMLSSEDTKENQKGLDILEEKGITLADLAVLNADSEEKKKPIYSAFDAMKFLWAMAKAQAYADNTQDKFENDFREWVIDNADFDINDCIDDFKEEAKAGFFRIKA